MPIPYPSSPTVGQKFTYGAITYTWNGVAWTYSQTNTTGIIGSVLVSAPITNAGTPTAPVIGINQAGLLLSQSQVTGLVADLVGKANLANGNTFTQQQIIVGTASGSPVLKMIPAASQSVDILQIRNSADSANLFQIGSGGAITSASGLTISGVGTFNNNISAFGTTTLWANQQLSLAVRNGTNAVTNLVQYSKNDTTVTGGRTTNGLIWAGTTAMENNQGYSLTTSAFVSTTQATFTTNSAVAQNPFAVGQKLIVTGVTGGTYNGSFIITAIGGSAGAWTATVTAPSGTTPFTNVAGTGGVGSIEPTLFVRQLSAGTPALTIKAFGAASGSTEPFRYIDSTGVVKTYMAASGDFVAPAISAVWSITSSAQDVTVNAIRARTSVASGYRANLQTWESSSTVLAGVNSPGKIFTGATSPATTTIGGTIQSIASGANPLVTMASAHGLSVGEVVTLAGTTGGTYDGTFFVATVPASTTFTITSALTTGQVGAAGTLAVPAQMTSIARNAGSVAALIRGASGQLASFVEVQNNAGTSLLRVNTSGFVLAPLGLVGGGTTQSTNTSSVVSNNTLYPTSATNIGLAVRGAASQSANLQEWQDSAGTILGSVSSVGNTQLPILGVGATALATLGGTLRVMNSGAGAVGITVRGASGQTANLQEWQNNTGGTATWVSPTGVVTTTAGLTFSGASAPLIAGGTAGTSGQVLTSGGAGVSPSWTTVSGGGSFTGGTLTSDLVLAAGSGTVEPLTFQNNTSTPTTTSGAMDYDGVVFYQTSNTNPGRALATQNYYYASSADYGPDFTLSGAVKSMLGGATTGITVAAGTTYEYEFYTTVRHQYITVTGITGTYQITSTTVSGSPTVAVVHQVDYGSNTTGFTTATTLSTVRTTGSVGFSAPISSGSRYNFLRAKGLIRVTGTGTVKIYPGLSTDQVGGSDNIWNVQNGTVFKLTPIGNGTVTTVGTWA